MEKRITTDQTLERQISVSTRQAIENSDDESRPLPDSAREGIVVNKRNGRGWSG